MAAPGGHDRGQSAILAARMAALAHPARLAILRHISGAGSCCCKDVVGRLDLAQSTVSQHIKVLVEAGLIRVSPDRQRSRYAVDHEALAGLRDAVASLVDTCCMPGPAGRPARKDASLG